jgi:hypothetical protein
MSWARQRFLPVRESHAATCGLYAGFMSNFIHYFVYKCTSLMFTINNNNVLVNKVKTFIFFSQDNFHLDGKLYSNCASHLEIIFKASQNSWKQNNISEHMWLTFHLETMKTTSCRTHTGYLQEMWSMRYGASVWFKWKITFSYFKVKLHQHLSSKKK